MLISVLTCALCVLSVADELPLVQAEAQPTAHMAELVLAAMQSQGHPLADADALRAALALDDDAALVRRVQEVLDRTCLVGVVINPEMRVKVTPGPADRQLVERGWRSFLVKVHNQAGTTAPLRVASPNAHSLAGSPSERLRERWLDVAMADGLPLSPTLSGATLEYRIIQLSSRDAGTRSATLSFDVGQGTQDLGFRAETSLTFECAATAPITLRVRDEHGEPTTAAFEIRDEQGRVYPSQTRRLAPDFAFHPQVYRADGESVRLPPGQYTIEWSRGPEYVKGARIVDIAGGETLAFDLKRWIDPAARGWWSGDHHIHAAGCAHYTDPTLGVHAEDMYRHIVGEDLKVGANLTWGPCFDYQKQFFTGDVDDVSTYPYLLRYDIEVSGFGSHQSGHLCLLRLEDQMFPGGDSSDHWPTLGLNTLRWAQAQGAVCGPAHSGFGLATSDGHIPSYEVPRFDGIGANEYIVDVTHKVPGPDGELVPAVDFMSTVDTPAAWELPIWYHTLNCGYRTRISGETDFPCIYGARVGMGRSYVKVDGELTYDSWCAGIEAGTSYVSDGLSHLLDFKVDDIEVGGELHMADGGAVRASVDVAALLNRSVHQGWLPSWHLEHARLDGSRRVPVELIVNGQVAATTEVEADGAIRRVVFDATIERSSWVAVRILHSSHTNPVFVIVGAEPIRASRRSAEWCLKSVDQCWSQKARFYDADEMEDAVAAYDHARQAYRRILSECEVD